MLLQWLYDRIVRRMARRNRAPKPLRVGLRLTYVGRYFALVSAEARRPWWMLTFVVVALAGTVASGPGHAAAALAGRLPAVLP